MADLRALTAHDAHLPAAFDGIVADGRARGDRVVSVHPDGGLHARVLADRGLDVGAAWVSGRAVSWTSAVGESRATHADDGEGWHLDWAGGLVTTCGLRNVGRPSGGHGRHGAYSGIPADDLRIERVPGEHASVVLRGRVRDTDALGRTLTLTRELVFGPGPTLTVDDVVTNEGVAPERAPILYHLNFGYPFVGPQTVLSIDGHPSADARAMGEPRQVPDEVVEHTLENEQVVASIDSARLGLRASVTFSTRELPQLWTWQRRVRGGYVFGVEPANCSVIGTEHDRLARTAPVLGPGASRRTSVSVRFEEV